MSPLIRPKPVVDKRSYTQYILLAYIIISAIFILMVAYSYFQGVVYKSWSLKGQQQWYEAAYIEIINAVSQKCETVSLNVWETTVSIINVICLQQNQQGDTTTEISE